ncbi:MAG: hypothetical protein K9J45_20615, partial [Bacteroidales bacterium]|nr:hypothetical protein [Bacteroidales bacterium]
MPSLRDGIRGGGSFATDISSLRDEVRGALRWMFVDHFVDINEMVNFRFNGVEFDMVKNDNPLIILALAFLKYSISS